MHAVVPRPRLFRELDAARERSVIWLAAHPGAGKTTLAATWLESRGFTDLWFQVDSGDSDPATFFLYLGQCLEALPRRSRRSAPALPLLTPEHLPDVAAFGRRFFRELFARLPGDSVLVLDNFQEIADDSVLHDAIAAGMTEVPEGRTLVIISRTAPSTRYARLSANRTIEIFAWERLRLTLDETQAVIAASPVDPSDALAQDLHRQSDGWAAGLTLMLERVRRNGLTDTSFEAETREATFHYFAGEVFDRTATENQQILLACAFLPRITAAQAERLSGHPGAGRLLDYLYRRHLFTDRRLGGEPIYQFHALFRQFLLDKAAEWYTEAGRTQIARRGAILLDDAGDTESAIALFAQAGEWTRVAQRVKAIASSWLLQGRAQTLVEWIGAVPPAMREADPWLDYWWGTALVPIRQTEARERLSLVLDRFDTLGDHLGQALSLCGIMESHYLENTSFQMLRPFGARLDQLFRGQVHLADHGQELRILTNLVNASQFTWVTDPAMAERVDRMLELLQAELRPDLRVTAAHSLLRHVVWAARFDIAQRVIDLTRPLLNHPSVGSLSRLIWWARATQCWLFMVQMAKSKEAAAQADIIAAELPGHPTTVTLATYWVCFALVDGDLERARLAQARARSSATRDSLHNSALLGVAHQYLSLHEGDLAAALRWCRQTVGSFMNGGVPHAEAEFRIGLTHLLYQSNLHDEAAECARLCRQRIHGSYLAHYEACLQLVEAFEHYRAGDACAGDLQLQHGLRALAGSTIWPLRLLPDVLPTLLSRALSRNIEPDAARRTIRQYALKPSDPTGEFWPWPVRIRALGGLELELENPPMESRKPQHKLKDLLRIIVACGGRQVPADPIVDALWPDADGDAALRNLEVYLTRLRKFLGHPEVVSLRDGRITLNADVCWLDVWAFEASSERVMARDSAGTDWESAAQASLRLYRGHLLHDERGEPFVIPMRDRLRKRWSEAVRRCVEIYRERNDVDSARRILDQAKAIDVNGADWSAVEARLVSP